MNLFDSDYTKKTHPNLHNNQTLQLLTFVTGMDFQQKAMLH